MFAPDPKKPKLVNNMQHHIITNDSQPVRVKPYRIRYAWNNEVNQQIQQMLDMSGILVSMSTTTSRTLKDIDPENV